MAPPRICKQPFRAAILKYLLGLIHFFEYIFVKYRYFMSIVNKFVVKDARLSSNMLISLCPRKYFKMAAKNVF